MQILVDKEINGHHIYLTDDNEPLLLPCLYARWVTTHGLSIDEVFKKNPLTEKIEHFFVENEIADAAQTKRLTYLSHFLAWIDSDESPQQLKLDNHTALPADYINQYINDYVVKQQGKSEPATQMEIIALRSYYNFLSFYLNNKYKKIALRAEMRKEARNNNKTRILVKYLLADTRTLLYDNAPNLRDEIILRNGGELGCRSMENRGFLLNDHKVNKETHKGLLSLFKEMDSNPDKMVFKYHLSSKYTKYGTARTLYLERYHLEKMKKYYEEERPVASSDHLFVNHGGVNAGQCIAQGLATRVFNDIRNKVRQLIADNSAYYSHYQHLSESCTYHHLRHSFGTDIFYEECQRRRKNYEAISTDSAVYLETALRMGHRVTGPKAPETTKTYIHSCGHREKLLREVAYG